MAQARRLALAGHGLGDDWALSGDRQGAAEVVARLGYVQIDTISVVARAHDHTIWSRHAAYQSSMLDALLARDRSIFEYWHHAAAYLPMADYRFSLAQMRANAQAPWVRNWFASDADTANMVLARIRDEGGLRSADFEAPDGFVRGNWWSRKPAKQALDALFARGDLMITAREGFQRRYDLPERVLPPGLDLTEPSAAEIGRHYVRQNLRRMGLAQERDLLLPRLHRKDAADALAEMVASGEAVGVTVEGLTGADGQPHYCLSERLDLADTHRPNGAAQLLSPFDPLVIKRAWLKRLFAFDYALECYLPVSRRVHGYYSLPILWGERFVGRMDAKADRKQGLFILRRTELEEHCVPTHELCAALAEAAWRYASFLGCGAVLVEETVPIEMGALLRAAVTASGHD